MSGPEIANISATSSKSIEVSWNKIPENDTNGDITYYLVCYKVQASADDICSKMTKVDDVVNRKAVLTELNEFTTYDVAIKAATSKGAGPPGGSKNVTSFQDSKYSFGNMYTKHTVS